MEQFQNHELENMVEDYYDMTDFEEDIDSQRNGVDESLDSDFEDDFEMVYLIWHRRLYIYIYITLFKCSLKEFLYNIVGSNGLLGLQSKPKTDTSAVEARNGKDIQGIPW